MLGSDIVHDAQAEPDGRRRVTGSDHQRIPDGLDFVGLMLGQ